MTITYAVPDMTCDHCKSAIEGEVGKIDGVTSVVVDLQAKSVTVEGGQDQHIREAIDEAGFDVAD